MTTTCGGRTASDAVDGDMVCIDRALLQELFRALRGAERSVERVLGTAATGEGVDHNQATRAIPVEIEAPFQK